MSLPKIENLQLTKVTEDVLLIHQIKTPFYFSCCDGLLVLPKKGRNGLSIALDINIEPKYVNKLFELFGPVSTYVCTHGHMDHISHVHAWEDLGATIYGPNPEVKTLLDLYQFYNMYGWEESVDYSLIEKFGKLNKYHECKKTKPFEPGDKLKFEEFELETIPFLGHSVSHVGLLLQKEKILHISCLGFDQPKPGIDGFGPWYGFRQCSISQYLDDIDKAEFIFIEGAEFLTSSHSYITKNPDKSPFEYMRRKIKENQQKVDIALSNLKPTPNFEKKVERLLKRDIFFPKSKMKGFLKKIYLFWERGIITKQVQRSKLLKYE
jgi:glyoxylase-like metal-dependent hydrolase (beta-lactamase superfamily II)